jgi:gluconolactonase
MFYGEIQGSGFEVIESEFAECFVGHARVERLWSGARWAEGAAWFGGGRYLIFSDLPNNRLMRFDETDGSVSVFRSPSGYANGNTCDREGRLITCEHLNRRVTRTEHDGKITVLADQYAGQRLNSPNDVVVKSDGSIWFTDPNYGIIADYEGKIQTQEQKGCFVYRLDPVSGNLSVVADDFDHPNGLAFSSDETKLFIADSGGTESLNGPRHIRHFEVASNGIKLNPLGIYAECCAGVFDGFRIDKDDRLWASSAEGVQCFNKAGVKIGLVRIPEMVSNVTFGGLLRNRLFICGTTSLYSVFLKING